MYLKAQDVLLVKKSPTCFCFLKIKKKSGMSALCVHDTHFPLPLAHPLPLPRTKKTY